MLGRIYLSITFLFLFNFFSFSQTHGEDLSFFGLNYDVIKKMKIQSISCYDLFFFFGAIDKNSPSIKNIKDKKIIAKSFTSSKANSYTEDKSLIPSNDRTYYFEKDGRITLVEKVETITHSFDTAGNLIETIGDNPGVFGMLQPKKFTYRYLFNKDGKVIGKIYELIEKDKLSVDTIITTTDDTSSNKYDANKNIIEYYSAGMDGKFMRVCKYDYDSKKNIIKKVVFEYLEKDEYQKAEFILEEKFTYKDNILIKKEVKDAATMIVSYTYVNGRCISKEEINPRFLIYPYQRYVYNDKGLIKQHLLYEKGQNIISRRKIIYTYSFFK